MPLDSKCPLTVFIFGGLLTSILIGPAETPADAVTEMMAKQGLKGILAILDSLGFVFIGTVLLCDSMQGDDKPGGVLARRSMIIFIALTALPKGASITDWALLGAIQGEAADTAEITAAKFNNAVPMQLVGNFGGFVLLLGYRIHLHGHRSGYAKEIAPRSRLDLRGFWCTVRNPKCYSLTPSTKCWVFDLRRNGSQHGCGWSFPA